MDICESCYLQKTPDCPRNRVNVRYRRTCKKYIAFSDNEGTAAKRPTRPL